MKIKTRRHILHPLPGVIMHRLISTAISIAAFLLLSCSVRAQVVNLWPGVAPGSENWTQKEQTITDLRSAPWS